MGQCSSRASSTIAATWVWTCACNAVHRSRSWAIRSLRRAVGNIIDNAVTYGERARLTLHEEEGACRLEIDDDGPGIPEALHARVFEPFFRAESSRNRATGGIGLGLSTVRAVVLVHGGDVQLVNRREGGLRVIVTMPVVH